MIVVGVSLYGLAGVIDSAWGRTTSPTLQNWYRPIISQYRYSVFVSEEQVPLPARNKHNV